MASDLTTWDGMSESDALLAIDGGGKWVLASDAMAKIAELEAEKAELVEALDEVVGILNDHLGGCYPVSIERALASIAKARGEPTP